MPEFFDMFVIGLVTLCSLVLLGLYAYNHYSSTQAPVVQGSDKLKSQQQEVLQLIALVEKRFATTLAIGLSERDRQAVKRRYSLYVEDIRSYRGLTVKDCTDTLQVMHEHRQWLRSLCDNIFTSKVQVDSVFTDQSR